MKTKMETVKNVSENVAENDASQGASGDVGEQVSPPEKMEITPPAKPSLAPVKLTLPGGIRISIADLGKQLDIISSLGGRIKKTARENEGEMLKYKIKELEDARKRSIERGGATAKTKNPIEFVGLTKDVDGSLTSAGLPCSDKLRIMVKLGYISKEDCEIIKDVLNLGVSVIKIMRY